MTKVKEKLYEHRFGLFFFAAMVGLCFYSYEGFLFANLDTTLSIYAVDFSIGLCNKILPGAIFNSIFDKTSINLVSGYIQALIYICFVFISVFLEKFIYRFQGSNRNSAWILSIFILLLFSVNTYQGRMFFLLDLHWLLSLFIFLFIITKKQLYIFMPIPFLYAITVHNGSVMCYIPLFILIALVKIYYSEKKSERQLLWITLIFSCISSAALCLYFVFYDADNIKITLEQMHALLESRGVKSFDFYDSYFNPQYIKDKAFEVLGNDIAKWLADDSFKISKENFIPLLIERAKWHFHISDHKDWLIIFSVNLPVVFLIAISLLKSVKDRTRRIFDVLAICLSTEVVVVGSLLSTDTERWIGHSVFSLLAYFVFVMINDNDARNKVTSVIENTSGSFIILSLLIGFMMCRV